MTVGPGIQPGLLTSPAAEDEGALAGLSRLIGHYRRWGIAPRPENSPPEGSAGFVTQFAAAGPGASGVAPGSGDQVQVRAHRRGADDLQLRSLGQVLQRPVQ